MAKHKNKEFDGYVDELLQLGFTTRTNGVTIMLYPPVKEFSIMTAHRGTKGMHHIRRYLKKYLAYTNNNK
jgi:hypothetical protein